MPRIRELTDNLFFTADKTTLSNKIKEYIDEVERTLCAGFGFILIWLEILSEVTWMPSIHRTMW